MKIENSGTVPAVTNKAPCFTQLNRDCHWLILGHVAMTKLKCIPIVISNVPNVPRSGYITARDHSMVESGVTLGEKNTARSCQFSSSSSALMDTTTQTRNLKLSKKQRYLKLSQKFPEEKQQLLEEKDADNIRKVLCKSFIRWF